MTISNAFIVYRDQDGQLYFIDQDGDLLYFDLPEAGQPDDQVPEQVLQLPGRYCLNNGRGPISGTIFDDMPKAVRIEDTWENIKARSYRL
jgi:hypothetical protein